MCKNHDSSIEEVFREETSHGGIWDSMHGGYFSSLGIAAPYIAKIAAVVENSQPDAVVDLGGGTGFILDQLSKSDCPEDTELINLDLSREQLDSIQNKNIIPKVGSISSFHREELGVSDKKTLFISRSTFHYAGLQGLEALVRHIRKQMLPGEVFLHQTACFGTEEDAEILNLVYNMMGTEKGYPTVRGLREILENEGFVVSEISKVPSLELTSESLMKRYGFDDKRMKEIIEAVMKKTRQEKDGVFHLTPNGYSAFLHYMVFTCRAV